MNSQIQSETIFTTFSDGGSRGNPGPAATGWLIFDSEGKLFDFGGKYLGEITNNRAEYEAVLQVLTQLGKHLKKQHLSKAKIICHLDSELVVKQLRGEYKIKDLELKKIFSKVQDLLLEFTSVEFIQVEFVHVVREKNTFADKLVNLILDGRS